MPTPCYIESKLKDGSWTREGWNAPRAGGHYAYPDRETAERTIPKVASHLCGEEGYETRIVDAEPGALVE